MPETTVAYAPRLSLTRDGEVEKTDADVRNRDFPRTLLGRPVKPAPFELHAPTTVGEAVDLLAELGDESKLLAGGQSLVPMLALRLTRFEHLIDLNGVATLASVSLDDGRLRIGAGTRQAAVGRDRLVAEHAPLLTMATPLIGHFQIRNRGTIGGSVAHADPASEYPAAVLALGGELEVTSNRGIRQVPADEFFTGMWSTILEPDELLSAIVLPPRTGRRGEAIEEVARRHGDFALAGAIAVIDLDTDTAAGEARVGAAAIATFGMGSTPLRATAAERALVGQTAPDVDFTEIARLAVRATEPPDDVHATAAYRRRVGLHLVERVLTRALKEATNAPR
jgi:carbon-monoxide dehydrogenase medium subunit